MAHSPRSSLQFGRRRPARILFRHGPTLLRRNAPQVERWWMLADWYMAHRDFHGRAEREEAGPPDRRGAGSASVLAQRADRDDVSPASGPCAAGIAERLENRERGEFVTPRSSCGSTGPP